MEFLRYSMTKQLNWASAMSEQNIFQKIIAGEIPADIVYEDEQCLAFHDIAPQAPTHVLVIPRKPVRSVAELEDDDGELVAHLWKVIRNLADQLGLQNGYRVVVNCGRDGGQEVEHLHYHLLGGRALQWPPG
jgi:histidine triad (HIT) family protein